jgi:hypothetical protein
MTSIPSQHADGPMTPIPSRHTNHAGSSDRTAGLVIGWAAAVLLLVALSVAAWGLGDDTKPLSFDDGLVMVGMTAAPAMMFVLFAGLSIAAARRWLGAGLMVIAAVLGFLGFALTAISRYEFSACG